MATLSIRCAIKGSFSQICVPGTFVAVGFQRPRISTGASGFGSKVSNWLGPPARNKKMQDISADLRPARGAACNHCGRERPKSPAPICNAARRLVRRVAVFSGVITSIHHLANEPNLKPSGFTYTFSARPGQRNKKLAESVVDGSDAIHYLAKSNWSNCRDSQTGNSHITSSSALAAKRFAAVDLFVMVATQFSNAAAERAHVTPHRLAAHVAQTIRYAPPRH